MSELYRQVFAERFGVHPWWFVYVDARAEQGLETEGQ